MRYVVTALFALGVGIMAMAPLASVQGDIPPNSSFTDQYGNQIVPMIPGGNDGGSCYMGGVAYSCTQPAPATLPTPSGSGGAAGNSVVCPLFVPCQETQFIY